MVQDQTFIQFIIHPYLESLFHKLFPGEINHHMNYSQHYTTKVNSSGLEIANNHTALLAGMLLLKNVAKRVAPIYDGMFDFYF